MYVAIFMPQVKLMLSSSQEIMTEEILQTMVLTSKEINSLMVDRFTFAIRCSPDLLFLDKAMQKLRRHFPYVDLLYACNEGVKVQANTGNCQLRVSGNRYDQSTTRLVLKCKSQ